MGKNDFDRAFDFEEEDGFDPKAFLDAEEYDDDIDLSEFSDEELGLSFQPEKTVSEDAPEDGLDLDGLDLDLDGIDLGDADPQEQESDFEPDMTFEPDEDRNDDFDPDMDLNDFLNLGIRQFFIIDNRFICLYDCGCDLLWVEAYFASASLDDFHKFPTPSSAKYINENTTSVICSKTIIQYLVSLSTE